MGPARHFSSRRHEPLGYMYHLTRDSGRLKDCAAFLHLSATFMREVTAGHLSVVVEHAIDKSFSVTRRRRMLQAGSIFSARACRGTGTH